MKNQNYTRVSSPVKTSKIAIAAAVFGISLIAIFAVGSAFPVFRALMSCLFIPMSIYLVFFVGIPAMILGILAIIKIKKSKGKLRGIRWALIGLIPGVILMLFLLLTITRSYQGQKSSRGIPSPGILIGPEFLSKSLFIEKEQLGNISDIAKGEFDQNPGPEIGIAGSQGALLMDISGKEISLVLFAEEAGHIEMIDVNQDGECEFMNRGGGWQKVSLFGHQGNKLWSYSPSGDAPNNMTVGDIDGDGILEFVVGFNGGGGIHLLDKNGKKKWRQPDANVWVVELVDINGDGSLEIVHSNAAGKITVRNRQGKIINQTKPSTYFSEFSLCRWPTLRDRKYILIYDEDEAIKILDFDGKTKKQFNAPGVVWNRGTWGMPARLKRDSPEYFAVIVQLRERWHRSILYVYDSTGSLVFQEIIAETCESVAVLPSDKPGEEILLVGGEGKVWQYKVQDTTIGR